MKYVNMVSSLLFLLIGYYIMFLLSVDDFKNIVRGYFLIYTGYFMVIYLGVQGLGFIMQKPGTKAAFLFDLLFSTLPLFLVGAAFLMKNNLKNFIEYNFFLKIYLITTLIDLIIFTIAAFSLAIYTDKNARAE